jgi:hypothetical protein
MDEHQPADLLDRGAEDDPTACLCRPCYSRPKCRFRACCACLPFTCCKQTTFVGVGSPIPSEWSKTGCYCCVQGLEGRIGTALCPVCLPFVCGCFGFHAEKRKWLRFSRCSSNVCCLHPNWAQHSIDDYLAIQTAIKLNRM